MGHVNKIGFAALGLGVLWILGELREKQLRQSNLTVNVPNDGFGWNFSIVPRVFRTPRQIESSVAKVEPTLYVASEAECEKKWSELRFIKAPTEDEHRNFINNCRTQKETV